VKRLGVAGWPVRHSRSPAMQNAALAELGLTDWHYQLLPLPPDLFAQTIRALPELGFVGVNVTVPHKHAALALAADASPAARAIGAANTLTFEGGQIRADNTDAPGLIDALGVDARGLTAQVLGAGGSARAAVWALARAGAAEVYVWNRTPSRATELAAALGASAVHEPRPADVLVNCTSVGLGATPDAGHPSKGTRQLAEMGLSLGVLGSYRHVIDLVYSDPPTELTSAARQLAIHTVDGIDVLAAQGAHSLALWTGREPPLALMRRAARGNS